MNEEIMTAETKVRTGTDVTSIQEAILEKLIACKPRYLRLQP